MVEKLQHIITELINIVGITNVLTNPEHKKNYETDWRNCFYGSALAVIFPKSTQETSQIVKLCNTYNISVIPQGGNTSLCGGATPLKKSPQEQLILNLSKMNQIIELDIDNASITVAAGCTLIQVANHVLNHDLYFPLSMASEGSCQIGGTIATNAGGIHVIKYGNMRNLVLGLEVVLPDGKIINQLCKLRKNNTNFDFKQLFIGSEGTLGIITKAVLQLYPMPQAFYTGLIGVSSISQSLAVLKQLKKTLNLCAFEIINKNMQEVYNNIFAKNQIPLQDEWLILFEIELFKLDISPDMHCLINENIFSILQNQQVNPNNIIIASNNQERAALWHIREHIPIAEKMTGAAIKHDIALPISAIEKFIDINAKHLDDLPELQKFEYNLIIFGHLGDGNLHYNLQFTIPDKSQLIDLEDKVNTIIYNDLSTYSGTFSAEHGIGQLKKEWYKQYCDSNTYEIICLIKSLLDSKSILNPNKIYKNLFGIFNRYEKRNN